MRWPTFQAPQPSWSVRVTNISNTISLYLQSYFYHFLPLTLFICYSHAQSLVHSLCFLFYLFLPFCLHFAPFSLFFPLSICFSFFALFLMSTGTHSFSGAVSFVYVAVYLCICNFVSVSHLECRRQSLFTYFCAYRKGFLLCHANLMG